MIHGKWEIRLDFVTEKAVELAKEPFTPDRSDSLPSLRSIAAELGTTVIRARKLLITANYFESPTASAVQKLSSAGKTVDEIGETLHLRPSAVYGYLPYNPQSGGLIPSALSPNAR